jgi:two-component system, sensor histidine kinase
MRAQALESSGKPENSLRAFSGSEASLKTGTNHRIDGVKVLLVEDVQDNRTLLSRLLRSAGASVEVAEDGAEGVQKALSRSFDVVLMDLQMPVMDGFMATDELRKNGYLGLIIALTAHAMQEDRKKCLENGFDDHISKPIERQALLIRLASHLSSGIKFLN